jgi:hypothetical protein
MSSTYPKNTNSSTKQPLYMDGKFPYNQQEANQVISNNDNSVPTIIKNGGMIR